MTKLRRYSRTSELDLYPEIATALASSTSLRIVQIWRFFYGVDNSVLDILASSRYIETFYLCGGHISSREQMLSNLPADMRRRASVLGGRVLPVAPVAPAVPVFENPFYTPMLHVTDDVRIAVWTRILEYALETAAWRYANPASSLYWFDNRYYSEGRVRALFLVSKEFQVCAIYVLVRSHLDASYRP